MFSTFSLISSPVGVQILITTHKKYLFRSLLPTQRTPIGVLFALSGALVASKLAPLGRDPSRRRPAVILERSEESRGGLLEDDNYRAELGSHSSRKPTGARSREARRRILACAKQKRVPECPKRTVEDACPYK